jgi:hypothetical protein
MKSIALTCEEPDDNVVIFNAELNYTRTQDTLFQALINLYKAMGAAGSHRPNK